MFSKALIVLCCVFAATAQQQKLDVQVCESGPKVEVVAGNCSNVTLSNGSPLYFRVEVTGGSASSGNLTGLYDTFSDSMCDNQVNTSQAISCTCEESVDLKFICNGSALAFPVLSLLIAALVATML